MLLDDPVHVCYTYTAEVSEMPAIHVINPPNIDIITGYLHAEGYCDQPLVVPGGGFI